MRHLNYFPCLAYFLLFSTNNVFDVYISISRRIIPSEIYLYFFSVYFTRNRKTLFSVAKPRWHWRVKTFFLVVNLVLLRASAVFEGNRNDWATERARLVQVFTAPKTCVSFLICCSKGYDFPFFFFIELNSIISI